MVYLLKMVIFHGYVSHNQTVYVFGNDVDPQAAVCSFQIPRERSEVVKIASIGMNQPCESGAITSQLRAMEFGFLDKA